MSAAIKSSLNKLNSAVYKLESAIEKKAASKKQSSSSAPQNDLFSAPPQAANNVNIRHLAKRLDTAIEQVETILKEGRG